MGHHVRERETCIPSRREALRSIGLGAAFAAVPVAALALTSEPHPDAELIRLGAEFDRLFAAWVPIWRESGRLARQAHAWLKAAPPGYTFEDYCAYCAEIGSDDAADANDALLAQLDALAERVSALPACGFAGLEVKARVLSWVCLRPDDYLETPEPHLGPDVLAFRGFIAELGRLAGAVRS